jgi:arabinan endo-1,5-alpha-L-arabinosidase
MRGSEKRENLLNARITVIVKGIILVLLTFIVEMEMAALHNDDRVHDPSAIIKCEDTYWIFGTGQGPHAMYSKDLVHWTEGQTPLTPGSFPPWVTTYVPGFEGHFWAPDCFYMNGQYYLYYSCSSWGVTVSCIGLLTSKSLNPDSPDYGWTDEGMVVYSTAISNYNCIDPAIMRDEEGRIWLTYGSHWDGIRMVELDSVSGKTKGGQVYSVAGKGDYKTEAAYTVNHGDYYYLFFNRGQCCQGTSSTYYIQVGRSSSPSGPFLDKSGTDCYQGGGTTVISSYGHRIGPGCLGYYVEDGVEFVTYHYYDGTDDGIAKLGVGTFEWSEDGWPTVSNDWIPEGDYSILNKNSMLSWDYSGSGEEGDPLIQNPYALASPPKWSFKVLGNAYYSINPKGSALVVGISPCTTIPGIGISLGADQASSCQIWRIERTPFNTFMFSSRKGNMVLEVPGSSTEAGTGLKIHYYSGTLNQQWMIADTIMEASAFGVKELASQVNVYPNPSRGGSFQIEFMQDIPAGDCKIEILYSDGKIVFQKMYKGERQIKVEHNFVPGSYFMRIITNRDITCKCLIIKN